MMGWGYGMGGSWLLMSGLWLLLIVVLVGLVVWIFPRDTRRGDSGQVRSRTPREVLDERLARGEIDVETYRVLREELSRSDPARR